MHNPSRTKKEGVKCHYEEQWERYSEEDVIKRVNNLSPVLDAIISNLKVESGARILDLGSGPGILPVRMCELNGEVHGVEIYCIDISPQAFRMGKRVIGPKGLSDIIRLVKGDCEELPFQNNCFDGVVSNATINLLLDKKKGFEEMARVTKGGGMVVLGDCTARDDKKCCQGDNDQLWSTCISGAPTKLKFRELAQNAGLEIDNIIEMTDEVTHLVKKGHWDWPEFIQYEMDYQVFVMRKG